MLKHSQRYVLINGWVCKNSQGSDQKNWSADDWHWVPSFPPGHRWCLDFLFTSKTGKKRNVERDIPINGSAVTEQFGETAVSSSMPIPLYLFPNIYTNSATTI